MLDKAMITEREEARRANDYDKADQLRDSLRSSGVELDDKDLFTYVSLSLSMCWTARVWLLMC